jgi:hypothetical protein
VGNIKLGPQFNENKFMHLLLNQWGYAIDQEASIHLFAVAERLAMLFSEGDVELANKKLPDIWSRLQNKFLQEITDLVKKEFPSPFEIFSDNPSSRS